MEQAEKMRWIMTREFMLSTIFQKCITVGQDCSDFILLKMILGKKINLHIDLFIDV